MKIQVIIKARKFRGIIYPAKSTDFYVEVIPGVSIQIFQTRHDGTIANSEVFRIGSTAEYDSYNLKYTGEITKITENSVTIRYWDCNHRLDLNTFCWRNINFNAARVAAENAETMLYI